VLIIAPYFTAQRST